MTDAAGLYARHIENFWWFAFILLSVVTVVVFGALFYAALHRHRSTPPGERRLKLAVGGAVAATALILVAYLLVDLTLVRAMQPPEDADEALLITITGHQWWWEIEYADTVPSRTLVTANELHLPVGRNVRVMTRSADVIHSLWIPQLHGKRDLIPGDTAYLWLRADRVGEYRGQCAEFCGHQHAHMALDVVVQSEAEFAEWYEQQLRPAEMPTDSLRLHGMHVFESRTCMMCHTIRGTLAGGRTAPDLTHIASRRSIAAGSRPNTRGYLAGWIMDPHSIKPGVRMPPNALTSDELHALLAYLEGLH